MAAKLDQSLDDIVKTDRRPGRPGRPAGRGRARSGRTVVKTTKTAGPVGGISKKVVMTKAAKGPKAGKATTTTTITTAKAPYSLGSKIVVSNLPTDVTEQMIKDYFKSLIGSIKSVELTYTRNGVSRGVATINFNAADGAHKAAQKMNGIKVDGKPMKVEVIVDAASAPAPKSLSERIATPKPVTAAVKTAVKAGKKGKAGGNAAVTTQTQARGKARGAAKGRNAGNKNGRGKPKTAAELDAEMTDYFGNGEVSGGQVAATNGAEVGMIDEIM